MKYHTRTVLPAPLEIVKDGRCAMGTYNSPIQHINLTDLKTPLGYAAPGAWNRFRLKEWQAFQINNDNWFICLAIYNTKSLGTAIIMAFNKREQLMYRYEQKVPAWQLTVPNGLFETHCYYHGRKLKIDFRNRLSDDFLDIEFHAKDFKGLPNLSGKIRAFHTTDPIVIIQPFAENRPLYSHKALMRAEGTVSFKNSDSVLSTSTGCAIVDDHKGYYPYAMHYDWVTALGFNAEKRLAGFNLTDNQIQNHEKYNENCLWLDGKMHPLPPVKVLRPNGVEKPWKISDKFDRVNLIFTPLADVPVNINIGIVKIKYHGPTGVFSGYVLDPDNNRVYFDGFYGMGEEKYIRM